MTKDDRVTIRLTPVELRKLDDVRRYESNVPTRPEMVRRLIARAYEQLDRESKRRE